MKYHTFLPQFHPLILAGSKRTTIRGSTRVQAGERFALRFWTGRPYGSPMGFLGTAECTGVDGVQLRRDSYTTHCTLRGGGYFGLATTFPDKLDTFARHDGFTSWAALVEHFGDRLPFDGIRISWRDFVPGAPA